MTTGAGNAGRLRAAFGARRVAGNPGGRGAACRLVRRRIGLTLAVFFLTAAAAPAAPLVVTAPRLRAAPGAEVTVPISLRGVKQAKGVRGMTIRLTYDPAILSFKRLEPGPALPGRTMTQKSVDEAADPGKLGLSFLCDTRTPTSKEFGSVEDDGVVLNVVFVVKDDAQVDQKSPLVLDNYRVIDTRTPPFELLVSPENGEVAVAAAGLSRWWWLIIAGAAVVFLALLALLFRRRPQPTETPAAAAMPSAGELPRFSPESPTFSYTCVKCGGVLQLPRAMAGKSFQCGACGTAQVARM